MKRLSYLIIGLLLALPVIATGQSSSFWRLVGTKLMPVANTWRIDSRAGFSGRTLTVSSLRSCSLIQTDASGVTSCGVGGTTYTAGQGLTLASSSFKLNSTITGSLVRFATLSGSTVKANNSLSSSGTLSVEGDSFLSGWVQMTERSDGQVISAQASSGVYLWFVNRNEMAMNNVHDKQIIWFRSDKINRRNSFSFSNYFGGDGMSMDMGELYNDFAVINPELETVFDLEANVGKTQLDIFDEEGNPAFRFIGRTSSGNTFTAIGTVSGSTIYAKNLLAASGSVSIRGNAASSAFVMTMNILNAGAEYLRMMQADGQVSMDFTTTTGDAGLVRIYDSSGNADTQIGADAGDTYFNGGGDVGINTNDPDVPGAGLEVVGVMSGAQLFLKPTTGTAATVIRSAGAKGSHQCFEDRDSAGWTACDYLNGVQSCRIASAAECP